MWMKGVQLVIVLVLVLVPFIININFAQGASLSVSELGKKKIFNARRQNEESSMKPGERESYESMSLSDLLQSPIPSSQDISPEKPKVYKVQLDPSFAVTTLSDPQKFGEVTSKAIDRFFKTFVRYLSVQMYDWSKRKD